MTFTFRFTKRLFTNYNYLSLSVIKKCTVVAGGYTRKYGFHHPKNVLRLQLRGRECRRRIFSGALKGITEGYCFYTIITTRAPVLVLQIRLENMQFRDTELPDEVGEHTPFSNYRAVHCRFSE